MLRYFYVIILKPVLINPGCSLKFLLSSILTQYESKMETKNNPVPKSVPVFFLLFLQKFLYTFKAYFKRLRYLVLFVAFLIQAEYVPASFYSTRLT